MGQMGQLEKTEGTEGTWGEMDAIWIFGNLSKNLWAQRFSQDALPGYKTRLAQREKLNSFCFLGVAYGARHGPVKNTRGDREEKQNGCLILPSVVLWFRQRTVQATAQGKMGESGIPVRGAEVGIAFPQGPYPHLHSQVRDRALGFAEPPCTLYPTPACLMHWKGHSNPRLRLVGGVQSTGDLRLV